MKRIAALIAALLICSSALACAASVPAAAAETAPVFTPTPEPVHETPVPKETSAPTPDAEKGITFLDGGEIELSDAFRASIPAFTGKLAGKPTVLIYHTHAREAFLNTSKLQNKNGKPAYRSMEPEDTVIHLGDILTEELKQRGFDVLHDPFDAEEPALDYAYDTMRAHFDEVYAERTFDLYIDLHRNAASVSSMQDDVVMPKGERTARLFFVVGTGISPVSIQQKGTDNWKTNYALAQALTDAFAPVSDRICKPIRVKQKVYNQDLGLSILAEIGHNANTMEDAERTVPYLADVIAEVLLP